MLLKFEIVFLVNIYFLQHDFETKLTWDSILWPTRCGNKMKKLVFGVFGSVCAFPFLIAKYLSTNVHVGPKNDHFDGQYFFNTDGTKFKTLKELYKWSTTRKTPVWQVNFKKG